MNNSVKKSSLFDLDENVAAMLTAAIPLAVTFIGYMSYAAWVIPLVVMLLEKNSQFVKLCAAQSLAATLVMFVCSTITRNLSLVSDGSFSIVRFQLGIIGLLLSAIQLVCLVILIITALNAYKMQLTEIPKVTDWLKNMIGYSNN